MPGAVGATLTETAVDEPLDDFSTSGCAPVAVSAGTCTTRKPSPDRTSGAVLPPTDTEVPLYALSAAVPSPGAATFPFTRKKFEPKTVIKPSGAPVVRVGSLIALMTALTDGAAVV